MEAVLADFCIPVAQWTLQPVVVSTTVTTAASGTIHHHHHSQSSDLSEILQTALQQARQRRPNTTVVFLGMDAPQLPLTELIAVCGDDDDDDTRATTTALLCPAADGGYGLLSVPPHADATAVFRNVVWSHPLTALSQLKALTDAHIRVTLGPLMHDVDEFSDVVALARRLGPQACGADGTAASESSLSRPSALVAQFPFATTPDATTMTTFSSCRYTRQALMDLGLLPS